MFQNIISHEYFWLSFLPISLLSVGFWLLFFDRADDKNHPIILLFLSLIAGTFSAIFFVFIGKKLALTNFLAKIIGEELSKIFFAILMMECLKKKFSTIGDGVIYGFAVGLGFSFVENIVYLFNRYNISGFDEGFWLNFQGRFWSTTLLHGVATALFGFYYAGAFLSKTVHKKNHKSPLLVFFVPPNWRQFLCIISLHVTRKHFLFKNIVAVKEHYARAIITEGFIIAVFVHFVFNFAIEKSRFEVSFFVAIFGLWFLGQKVKKLCKNKIQK